jgi:chromosome partitioning protein
LTQNTAKCIVFHSYKGGTGKTTIAANIAALLAKRGHRVVLLDLDVYAPSLHSYFEIEPEKWINDYLLELAEVKDVLLDMTSTVSKQGTADSSASNTGKLWVGFSNPDKEAVYKLEGGKQEKVQLLRRFISLREQIFSDLDANYFIIDTSPGIRYWSINALAVADILYLTLKSGDLDIAGTKKMASDIYSTFKKFGAKPYLLLNKVAGYCVPHTLLSEPSSSAAGSSSMSSSLLLQQDTMADLSKEVGIDVISALPCFCDIQFSKKEYLTVLHSPEHPFSKMIEDLTHQSREISEGRLPSG